MPSPARHTHTPGAAGASACCTTGHIPSLFLLSSRLGLPKLFRLTLNSYVTQADPKSEILGPYPPKMPRWFAHAPRHGWVLCLWEQKKKSTEARPRLLNLLPFALASNGPKLLVKEGKRKPALSPKPPREALSPGFSSRS